MGDNIYFGFAGEKLIEEYQLDFLNLRARTTSESRRSRYRAKLPDPTSTSKRGIGGF
jgi:hypothetical protein